MVYSDEFAAGSQHRNFRLPGNTHFSVTKPSEYGHRRSAYLITGDQHSLALLDFAPGRTIDFPSAGVSRFPLHAAFDFARQFNLLTLSAPAGTGAPVMILTASPGFSSVCQPRPGRRLPNNS